MGGKCKGKSHWDHADTGKFVFEHVPGTGTLLLNWLAVRTVLEILMTQDN